MSDLSKEIRKAYNQAAKAYRDKYDSIPTRKKDVELTFKLAEIESPSVLEIGCAYGREAKYILSKTDKYIGVDISDEFIKMAKEEITNGTFVQYDIMEYEFPDGIDVVFAFASLLHNSKEDINLLLRRVHKALNKKGLIFLSLKMKPEYSEAIETDNQTSRRFYYYNRETINDISKDLFKEIYYSEQSRDVSWFSIILQKI